MKPLAFISVSALSVIAGLGLAQSAKAENLPAFCSYIPDSPLQTAWMEPCSFSRQQDAIEIIWEEHDFHSRFESVEEEPGLYTDEQGGVVYAQKSYVGADVQFRLEHGTVLVYWNNI